MEGNQMKMREALSDACYAMFNFLKTQSGGYEEMAIALDKAKAALSAPQRVCDVNTLESLSDFVEKTMLTSDLLKDTSEIVKSVVMASVRTALTVAYEPANMELKQRKGEVDGRK